MNSLTSPRSDAGTGARDGYGRGKSRRDEYVLIGVVVERFGVHPQTLRLYEREGYLAPRRTKGGTRVYSERDVEEVRRILPPTCELGVNLAGVEVVLEMRRKMERLQAELDDALEFVRREVKREVERQRSRTALVRVGAPPAARPGPGGGREG